MAELPTAARVETTVGPARHVPAMWTVHLVLQGPSHTAKHSRSDSFAISISGHGVCVSTFDPFASQFKGSFPGMVNLIESPGCTLLVLVNTPIAAHGPAQGARCS